MCDKRREPNFYKSFPATIAKARLTDIAGVFNIVQEASAAGFFNPVYTEPSYQAGLAVQLFSVSLLGRIRLPDGTWSHASLEVVRQNGDVVGFILIRDLDVSGLAREIYMCAVGVCFRHQGLGRQLLEYQLKQLKDGGILKAQCLPRALSMKRLLRKVGFQVDSTPSNRFFAGKALIYIFCKQN